MSDLSVKMEKVRQNFDVDELLGRDLNEVDVDSYYRFNRLLYKFMLSWKGYMHMGITYGEEFSKDDLEEIPQIISKNIEETSASRALELGCGTGANLGYLSSRHSETEFKGLDHSKKNVSKAKEKLGDNHNCTVEEGDFHDLSNYQEDSFDLVYVIEALCYSQNERKVLEEVKRIIKPGGLLLVFDGYIMKNRESLDDVELQAQRLLERSFMLEEFTRYDDFVQIAKDGGYNIKQEENFSEEIRPTAERFPTLTNLFFNHSKLNYPVRTFLPDTVQLKAISAYLMKDLVKEEIDGYYFTKLGAGEK